jgi:hypothetical protein
MTILSKAISTDLSKASNRGSFRRAETPIGKRRSASSNLTCTFALIERIEQSGSDRVGGDQFVAVLA